MGKLIAIDGVDASGKQTHTQLLAKKLISDGYNVKLITFPDYNSQSSSLVKMYLSGEFGKNPEDVSAYVASTFFAADRFASYKTNWQKDYISPDTIIIADRYTSSNMIHQASKIQDKDEVDKFLKWLYDLEFGIYGLPEPDITFFLDMPVEYAKKLMQDRENKFDNSAEKDIHESNTDYLLKSYNNACYVADKLLWKRIFCVEKGNIRSINEINDEIYKLTKSLL